MKIQRYRKPAGQRRVGHTQGCDEWIPFCLCGGPLLPKAGEKTQPETCLSFSALGVQTQGAIFLSIYVSSYVYIMEIIVLETAGGKKSAFLSLQRSGESSFYSLLLLSRGV